MKHRPPLPTTQLWIINQNQMNLIENLFILIYKLTDNDQIINQNHKSSGGYRWYFKEYLLSVPSLMTRMTNDYWPISSIGHDQ